jgi:CMP-N,N'-diacetyllegionaminic acid synthase
VVKTAAIIPARGGSKRILAKNLRTVGGVSLVGRAIESAVSCDAVYVSTDSGAIAAEAARYGVHVVERPAELATDTATTEAVMQHWWRTLPLAARPDALVLLQPTSPLRNAHHVSDAIALLQESGADSVVSVKVNPHAIFAGRSYGRPEGWREFRPFRPKGFRPRTQDARVVVEEQGAIYVTRRAAWESSWDRMSGVCAEYRMSEDDSIDVDTEQDLARAEDALRRRQCARLPWRAEERA